MVHLLKPAIQTVYWVNIVALCKTFDALQNPKISRKKYHQWNSAYSKSQNSFKCCGVRFKREKNCSIASHGCFSCNGFSNLVAICDQTEQLFANL